MSDPSAFQTRRAGSADLEAIAAIYNQGIEDRVATFETELRRAEELRPWLQRRIPTVVAEADGRVVAWASASLYRDRPCYDGVAEFSVYVAREHRGRGAGRAALSAL